MSNSSDPAGHIKISVSDAKKSAVFERLGFKKIKESEKGGAWATLEGFGVWIKEAEQKEPSYVFGAPGLHHLCFKARSKE